MVMVMVRMRMRMRMRSRMRMRMRMRTRKNETRSPPQLGFVRKALEEETSNGARQTVYRNYTKPREINSYVR